MFFKEINYLDDILNNQTLILKRSSVYLYKVFIYLVLIFILIVGLFLVNLSAKDSIPFFLYFIFGIYFLWLFVMYWYISTYNNNLKKFYLNIDKDILTKSRVKFNYFMNISIFLLIIVTIVFILNFFVIINNLFYGDVSFDFNSFYQLFVLLVSIFLHILITFLSFLILKRFFRLEKDIIIFDETGIKKIIHNSFYSSYPYFLSVDNIKTVTIKHGGFLNSIFDLGSIVIKGKCTRHYNYLKEPKVIYDIVMKLLKNKDSN